MTAVVLIVNNVHLLLQEWAGDSSKDVLSFVTKEKHQALDMTYISKLLVQ